MSMFDDVDRVVGRIDPQTKCTDRFDVYNTAGAFVGSTDDYGYTELENKHMPVLTVSPKTISLLHATFHEEENEWRLDGAPDPVVAVRPGVGMYMAVWRTAAGRGFCSWGLEADYEKPHAGRSATALLVHATNRVMAGHVGDFPNMESWLAALRNSDHAADYRALAKHVARQKTKVTKDAPHIKVAVLKLDPENDSHWISAGPHKGKPKLSAVRAAYGKTWLTYQHLEMAVPGWTREQARRERRQP